MPRALCDMKAGTGDPMQQALQLLVNQTRSHPDYRTHFRPSGGGRGSVNDNSYLAAEAVVALDCEMVMTEDRGRRDATRTHTHTHTCTPPTPGWVGGGTLTTFERFTSIPPNKRMCSTDSFTVASVCDITRPRTTSYGVGADRPIKSAPTPM